MTQAEATSTEEPSWEPVRDLDEAKPGAKDRSNADFRKVQDAPPYQDSPIAEPKPKKGAGSFLALIVVFATIGGVYYYFKTHGLPSGKVTSAPVVAPGAALPGPLESSTHSTARGRDGATREPSALSPQPAKAAVDTGVSNAAQNVAQTTAGAAVRVDTAQNIASIKVVEARLEDISKQVATLADDIKTLIAGQAQSKEQLAQLTERARPIPAPAVAASTPAAPRYSVARVAAPKPVQPATIKAAGGATNVVSVDMWNGTPSVAISEGDNIRFMSPGDVTAQGLTVKNADPVSQQVTFGMPSGEEVTARVDARK